MSSFFFFSWFAMLMKFSNINWLILINICIVYLFGFRTGFMHYHCEPSYSLSNRKPLSLYYEKSTLSVSYVCLHQNRYIYFMCRISVFTVRMKKPWVLSYSLSPKRRFWSDWADAQADLNPRWAHSHFVGFTVRRSYFFQYLLWFWNLKQADSVYGKQTPCWITDFAPLRLPWTLNVYLSIFVRYLRLFFDYTQSCSNYIPSFLNIHLALKKFSHGNARVLSLSWLVD